MKEYYEMKKAEARNTRPKANQRLGRIE